jgi:RNA-directed DNA polymerase
MTANAACAGAPSGDAGHWHDIYWATCYREVRRLQTRIFKATKEGRWGKVKALQWLLPHSFAGKALAVRRVTENHGKKTPGVDKVTWSTPDAKYRAVKKLSRHGYAPRPLRRIYIPKSNGKMRALGIPAVTGWHVHHIVRRVDGGSDAWSNLVMVHPDCHRQIHSRGLTVMKPAPKRGL